MYGCFADAFWEISVLPNKNEWKKSYVMIRLKMCRTFIYKQLICWWVNFSTPAWYLTHKCSCSFKIFIPIYFPQEKLSYSQKRVENYPKYYDHFDHIEILPDENLQQAPVLNYNRTLLELVRGMKSILKKHKNENNTQI